ncbi:uncharacterized protein LOC120429064 [Culex pipiens pallens]|uniref:uncharacterized protein LOC120429064 n=1 Tax=Culex pipiens pallens TaxID=42434 RepID=UPI001952B380|nr:uncharacterized protein LOC120429064 [Culex pipiens pallens]
MDRIASLPPELLANIFKFLSGNALRQVRLVCHRWRCVVSSYRALATRLALRLKRGNGRGSYWMGQNFQPPPLVPVSSFAFVCWGIEGVDGWWPAFGRKLTVLTMTACTVRFEVFVAMLRVTPNLKCLELDVMSFEGSWPVAPDFRLEHVEKLWMIRVYCEAFSVEDVIEVLTVMCPRVKDFAMRMLVGMEILQKVMRRFETTLEKFQVKVKRRENDLKAYPIEQHPPENLVADMCILQGLRLKRVSMDVSDPFDEKDWKRLIQAQPDIEELILYVDFSWRLKRIAAKDPSVGAPSSVYYELAVSQQFPAARVSEGAREQPGKRSDSRRIVPSAAQGAALAVRSSRTLPLLSAAMYAPRAHPTRRLSL